MPSYSANMASGGLIAIAGAIRSGTSAAGRKVKSTFKDATRMRPQKPDSDLRGLIEFVREEVSSIRNQEVRLDREVTSENRQRGFVRFSGGPIEGGFQAF